MQNIAWLSELSYICNIVGIFKKFPCFAVFIGNFIRKDKLENTAFSFHILTLDIFSLIEHNKSSFY